MSDTSTPRRRSRWNVVILAAAGAFTAVTLGILLTGTHDEPPGPRADGAVVSLPPASPGLVSAGYVGSHWRLTGVTDGRGGTEIARSVGAWLDLSPDGTLLAYDGVNTINARFTTTSAGFDVSEAGTTLVAYGDDDPAELAAQAGIGEATLAPVGQLLRHVVVLSADRDHLTTQAGGMRLTFVRAGPSGSR